MLKSEQLDRRGHPDYFIGMRNMLIKIFDGVKDPRKIDQCTYEREFGITKGHTTDSQRDIENQAIRAGRLVFNRFCLLPDYELPV